MTRSASRPQAELAAHSKGSALPFTDTQRNRAGASTRLRACAEEASLWRWLAILRWGRPRKVGGRGLLRSRRQYGNRDCRFRDYAALEGELDGRRSEAWCRGPAGQAWGDQSGGSATAGNYLGSLTTSSGERFSNGWNGGRPGGRDT
jgi:hypothetical protein